MFNPNWLTTHQPPNPSKAKVNAKAANKIGVSFFCAMTEAVAFG
jgi:hypothetical protein